MKKSTIKYLAILIVIVILSLYTLSNLETEPKTNISTIDQKQLKKYINKNITYKLKYVNLTYGNSKAEYIIEYHYIPEIYIAGEEYSIGTISIYKLNQKLNFPLTSMAIEIKNIKLCAANSSGLISHPKPYRVNNNTIDWFLCTSFDVTGNNSIYISFNILPVYNIWIYHFNGKTIHFNYNYTLESKSCT